MDGVVLAGGGRHSFNFYDVISLENLLIAWQEFSKGKHSKFDVSQFELDLENNLFELHNLLTSGKCKPDSYKEFSVYDPKLRKIHKASVRDRVLHQAVYRALYQIFDSNFIFHSYSSRNSKGIYAGICSFEKYINKVSKKHTQSCFILKCDIRKFFDSIDHNILFNLLSKKIIDKNLLLLLKQIICSFEKIKGKGLPLGNVTSQIFSNIYLNELDQYIKHDLRVKCYVRYCDDFVLVSDSKLFLDVSLEKIKMFCKERLLIDIHPNKIIFRKAHQGIDFLGYVMLPHRRVLRTKTKNRLLKKLTSTKILFDRGLVDKKYIEQVTQSYLGLLSHCKGEDTTQQIERIFWD
jgi:retron-type reverse transcriptase